MDRVNESVTSGIIPEAKSAYDLELFGINDGSFVLLHSLAITCLGLSILSALCVIVASTMDRGLKGIFSWTKSERFVFYLACTETILGITHLLDHSQILITRDHVRPAVLCQAYGFVLYTFVFAELFTVNIIAVTIFFIIYLRKKVEYGSRDWKVFLWIFGLPFTSAVVLASMGQFGTNTTLTSIHVCAGDRECWCSCLHVKAQNSDKNVVRITCIPVKRICASTVVNHAIVLYCLFDAVRGTTSNSVVAIPIIVILITNTILYGLTWHRIRSETRDIEVSLGPRVEATSRSHRAARNMLLFLVVYFIQWWPASVLSILVLFPNPPSILTYLVATFSNIGGILNGVVYFFIRRRSYTSS
ncbi:uncharacterized protein LOC110453526 isoform X1 [Mizuhopecten yessoensis]|uniref:uncharacterized protein LOC110453526 isoform X1 n=1 Tax=Mizuhopecten yessoensis TaxID=6573 RepID=UPI000B45994C|nr:uncharacterized protein LOC110453526 isoform X1 [Mizuhopecten yessoensis]